MWRDSLWNLKVICELTWSDYSYHYPELNDEQGWWQLTKENALRERLKSVGYDQGGREIESRITQLNWS